MCSSRKNQIRLVDDFSQLVTINRSEGGCLVYAPQKWNVGDRVTRALASQQGVPMGTITLEDLRIDQQGRAALRFTSLSPLL